MASNGYSPHKLREILTLEYGASLREEDRTGGTIPVLGSNGVVGHHNQPLVHGPGIVVGRKGSIGEVNWVEEDFWPIDTTYYVQQTTDHDTRWLYYLLDYLSLGKLNSATGVPGLNRDDVYSLMAPIPDENQAKTISNALQTVDEAIEATRAVIDQTRRLKTALLQDLLTNGLPGRHKKFNNLKRGLSFPESWEYLPLDQVAEFQNGKAFPSSDYDQGTVPLLRPGNLHISGRVMWDVAHTTTVPDRYLHSASEYIVRSNELVMNLTAQSLEDDFLGRVCWTHKKEECCLLNQRLARFRAVNCNLRFLYWTFKGPAFRDHVSRLPSGSKVQHLYNADLESFYVPLPDPAEQEKIFQLLDSVEEREQEEHSYLQRLFATKSALSQGLLTGHIPVKGKK